MTIENSEETAQIGVADAAQRPASDGSPVSTSAESRGDGAEAAVAPSVPPAPTLDGAQVLTAHASVPPMSRKLAPPPKPKRDSGMASSPPPARAPGEGPDLLASSSALKAPIAPTISYSGPSVEAGDAEPKARAPEAPEPPSMPPSGVSAPLSQPPLSQPPPIPRRRSNPALSADDTGPTNAVARPASDPALGSASELKPVSIAPRPQAMPPRPRSEPPAKASSSDESAGPVSAAPMSAPPSSSAIFAMRIIAVGDSVRPPPVQEPVADLPPDAFPPSASRLGTGARRSSRPALAAVSLPEAPGSAPLAMPAAPPVPAEAQVSSPDIDIPIDEEPVVPAAAAPVSPTAVESLADAAPAPADLAPAPSVGVAQELSDVDVSPDSGEKQVTPAAALEAAEAEELGREDAISMPPEELAALQAELQAKADAVKPPPPPKRGSTPGSAASGVEPTVSAPAAPATPPRDTPPTPDLAAAKAAQRSKTRQPWWEDLFNEDFMRASSRVSDEQIRREVTFIEESLGVAAGGVVLDLGCGAGHHAVELASRGYGVVGYDLSLYQLALAADVAQERSQKINFLQGDMREMAFEEMFDGVFCWNTTFGYFEEDKNLAVAQRVFKALRPGGMFLIDVLNRDFAAASAPCTVWYEGDSCVCMDDMSVDYISSRLRVKRSIILDDGRTKESLFSLRLYSLHELGKLLHEVGFRVTEASGHPATPGVFFGPNSPRIIMLAQRP
jgi:SAM-dependent methyltransferase